MRQLASRAAATLPSIQIVNDTSGLSAVRRQMFARERSIHELQTIVEQLCETNRRIHEKGLLHISRLEAKESAAAAHIAHLEAKAGKAVSDFEALAQEWHRFRQIHEKALLHISRLEARESAAAAHIAHLEAKAGKAVSDFEALAQEWRRFRSRRFIRLALAVARIGRFLASRFKAGSA